MKKAYNFVKALWFWYVVRWWWYFVPPKAYRTRDDTGQTLDDDR